MKKLIISIVGILLIGSFAFAELELPKQPDNLKIVSYQVYFNDDGTLNRVEFTGNLLKGEEIIKSGEITISAEDLAQEQIDYLTKPKDTKETQLKVKLGL